MEQAYLSAIRSMARELKGLERENAELRKRLDKRGETDTIIQLIPENRYDRIWDFLASFQSWLVIQKQSFNNVMGDPMLIEVIKNQNKLIKLLEIEIANPESRNQLKIEKSNNHVIRLIPKFR